MNEQVGDTPFRPTNVFVLASCLNELTVQRARERMYKMKYFNPQMLREHNIRLIFLKDNNVSCPNMLPISAIKKVDNSFLIYSEDNIDQLSLSFTLNETVLEQSIDIFNQQVISHCMSVDENRTDIICVQYPFHFMFRQNITTYDLFDSVEEGYIIRKDFSIVASYRN